MTKSECNEVLAKVAKRAERAQLLVYMIIRTSVTRVSYRNIFRGAIDTSDIVMLHVRAT